MSKRLEIVPNRRGNSDVVLPVEVVRLSRESEIAIQAAISKANRWLGEVDRLCTAAERELDRKLAYAGSPLTRPRVQLCEEDGRVRLFLSYGS